MFDMSNYGDLRRLVLLANQLDKCGLYKEADLIDSFVLKNFKNIKFAREDYLGDEVRSTPEQEAAMSRAVQNVPKAINEILNKEIVGQIIDLALDVAGLFPAIGAGADLAGFLWSAYTVYLSGGTSVRNWINTFISSIGLIPEIGSWVEITIKNVFKRIPYAPVLKYKQLILQKISDINTALRKLSDPVNNLIVIGGSNSKLAALQTATNGQAGFTIAKWASIAWNALTRFYDIANGIFQILEGKKDVGLDGAELAPTMNEQQQITQFSPQSQPGPGGVEPQPNIGGTRLSGMMVNFVD